MADHSESPWDDPDVIRVQREAAAMGLDLGLAHQGQGFEKQVGLTTPMDYWEATLSFDERVVRTELGTTAPGAAQAVLDAYEHPVENHRSRTFGLIVIIFLIVATTAVVAYFALRSHV